MKKTVSRYWLTTSWGESLEAAISLTLHNTKVGAAIAVEYGKL